MSTRAGWLVLPVTALILGVRLVAGARVFHHPSLKRAARSWKLIAVVGCVAAAAILAPLRARLQYDPHFGYRDRPRKPGSGWGPISRYVHQNLRNQRIVVCGDEMLFPLYGDDLSNAVFVYSGPATANELARCCAAQGASYAVWYRECREATKSEPASGGDSRTGEAAGVSVEFESGSACLLRMQGAGIGAPP